MNIIFSERLFTIYIWIGKLVKIYKPVQKIIHEIYQCTITCLFCSTPFGGNLLKIQFLFPVLFSYTWVFMTPIDVVTPTPSTELSARSLGTIPVQRWDKYLIGRLCTMTRSQWKCHISSQTHQQQERILLLNIQQSADQTKV